jgi:3',5'-cyclic AMP phosphodiesterase CpdA
LAIKKQLRFPLILSLGILVSANFSTLQAQTGSTQIAFLADIHLQDVYADLHSVDFQGVFNPSSGNYATIRTMKSQLNSTRLFNENYFAFISALEDLKKRGIQLVVLPGDFTDDGQPMNVLALKKILDHYSATFGMRFFLTTGNHDPVKPFGGIAGKSDFLATDGSEQAIAGSAELFKNKPAAISDQINYWRYQEITQALATHGFFPNPKDLFWSHPFEELEYETYSYTQAYSSSKLENRVYSAGLATPLIPDASYVVEPVEGIWLLALDGNVYSLAEGESSWNGSSIGFNQAVTQKKHQLEWIKKVSKEAEKHGKTLISFSHYPLVEFHDGASEEMKALFGLRKFQLERVPSPETSQLYAAAGIRIHFAGHMHINDTGLFQDQTTNSMYNIQVPSLAAFPPAYKTVKTSKSSPQFEIETISLTEVDHMNEFFDLYRMEHRWLAAQKDAGIWDSSILASKDYLEYTRNHLLELTKSRFIPSDWPENLVSLLSAMSNEELIIWSKMTDEEGLSFLEETLKSFDLTNNTAAKIIDDFYLLKNGDELGKKLIATERIAFYESLFLNTSQKTGTQSDGLQSDFIKFFHILEKFFWSLPADHFMIDLSKNTIERIE